MRKDTIEIPGKGQTIVTAGGVGLGKKATWDLTHLSTADPSGGTGGTFGYCYELRVRFDGNLKNGNAASRTVKAKKLPDALAKTVRLNANGHLFFDLADMAGNDLRQIDQIQTGRLPQFQGADYVVPGSGTNGGILAFTYQFTVRMYEPRLNKPTDKIVPIKLLQKAVLEFTSAAAGELGADISVDSYAITVVAKVVERDHYRQPALWSWIEKRQSSNDDFLSPAEVQYQDVHIAKMFATGLTTSTFATDGTEVTTVLLKVDSDQYVETITPQDMIGNFNSENPYESAAFVPDPSAGTDIIPVFWLTPNDGQITKSLFAENAPKLKLGGTADPQAGYRVLIHIAVEQTTDDFARHAVRGGVTIPKGSIVRSKTEDKVPVQRGYEHHSAFLPAELVTPQ